jgi:rhodanese-related sulfurtransferase
MTSADTPIEPKRSFASISCQQCRAALVQRQELVLLDAREEAPFSEAHPLFAANLPLSRIEVDAARRIPRRDTLIVIYDDGEGLALKAAQRLSALGYRQLALLEGGLVGWRDAGGEIFSDVNTPSKAFGELVESNRHTPSLPAPEVKALLDAGADVVVLDARRFDEYNTMSIPQGISVPGAELVLRVRELAPRPETKIIVNCAGRTRSIIGAQSLINAGIPNPVAALRNGTIGWVLAGQTLETGKIRRFSDVGTIGTIDAIGAGHAPLAQTQQAARAVADRARVGRTGRDTVNAWHADLTRTTYLFDIRTPEEYAAGHLSHFQSAPGGQLVQETDHAAPVRGARIVLADDDGVRANMTASWLAQMGWEVYVLDGLQSSDFDQTGDAESESPVALDAATAEAAIPAPQCAAWLAAGDTVLLDVGASANYVKQHIPGAWFALRSQLAEALTKVPRAKRIIVTCETGLLAPHAIGDLREITQAELYFIEGGNAAWIAAGFALQSGETALASPRIDRYRRPYEGTDNRQAAMQAYLDWEYGLVAQLARDGTHGFYVI